MAPSHYLNQCCHIVNWTLRNKLQWNFNRNSYIFIQENASEKVVWKKATILSLPQCVKITATSPRGQWVQMKTSYNKHMPAHILTHWGRVAHVSDSKLTTIGPDNGLSPGWNCHYLNQYWNIVNSTIRNKIQWNLNRNSYVSIQGNAFGNVVCEMVAILSWPQCVQLKKIVQATTSLKQTRNHILKDLSHANHWIIR